MVTQLWTTRPCWVGYLEICSLYNISSNQQVPVQPKKWVLHHEQILTSISWIQVFFWLSFLLIIFIYFSLYFSQVTPPKRPRKDEVVLYSKKMISKEKIVAICKVQTSVHFMVILCLKFHVPQCSYQTAALPHFSRKYCTKISPSAQRRKNLLQNAHNWTYT